MSVLLGSPKASGPELRDKHPQVATQDPTVGSALKMATSKPSFHLTAPNGWMNDPCGLGYDFATGLYHIFFQWNPHGNDWGNMSWGHATSTDLVSWKVSPTPALTPSTEYDCCGVFTGCLQATNIQGKPGSLTAMYTSVRHLPLHYTLPYTTGCESISLTTSDNGGQTWKRLSCNPVLTGPPEHLSVTGWRDPHLTTWPEQQKASPANPNQPLYGIVSGGVVDKAPAIFVYKVDPTDLRRWKYVGLLVDVGLNFHPSRWSGDFGVNWEVGNLATLSNDTGDSRDFAIMGAEGCLRGEDSLWTAPGSAQYKRQARGQLWMCVKPHDPANNSEALADYAFAGHFDHGCLYAANSFWDPVTAQRIVYGWITEEDLPDGPRHRQGWSGLISIPRVVHLMTLRNVTKARSSQLKSITSLEVIPNTSEPRTYTIQTLGIKPDPRLSLLRKGAERRLFQPSQLPISLRNVSNETLALTTSRWELEAEFSINESCERVGIQIAHSSDFKQRTTLSYTPSKETFTIHRPTLEDQTINHGYESAPHTLFTYLNEKGVEIEESLHIHAFFDKSVLEVFVNGRTVISTRIYHPSEKCFGIRFFAEEEASCAHSETGNDAPASLTRAEVWDGLVESQR
ncbi:Putative Glycosyl hydrolases family 32 superfamily [Penicillium brasilianum]|uniref:Putative Glycosyl hydrolases family 32 superfamily n=1 Tax=Penicillium brasilianum TaxID=104259 RepID=A0A0F7VEV3_PENBI|nr:Putative Glycosyl hydrolases family 32 superfamily [Penicillium brasilianum]